jgi:hypothetical protein
MIPNKMILLVLGKITKHVYLSLSPYIRLLVQIGVNKLHFVAIASGANLTIPKKKAGNSRLLQ